MTDKPVLASIELNTRYQSVPVEQDAPPPITAIKVTRFLRSNQIRFEVNDNQSGFPSLRRKNIAISSDKGLYKKACELGRRALCWIANGIGQLSKGANWVPFNPIKWAPIHLAQDGENRELVYVNMYDLETQFKDEFPAHARLPREGRGNFAQATHYVHSIVKSWTANGR